MMFKKRLAHRRCIIFTYLILLVLIFSIYYNAIHISGDERIPMGKKVLFEVTRC